MEEKETMGAAVIGEISIKIGPIRVRSLCLSFGNVEEQNSILERENGIERWLPSYVFVSCGAVKLNLSGSPGFSKDALYGAFRAI